MITNNSNNNIVFYDKTQSVNVPLRHDSDVNYRGNDVADKYTDFEVINPLSKRKINFKKITIGLPFRITCKLTLDILKSDKKCLYPYISIANEVYCLLTELQMSSFFKHKKHLVSPFLEETKQRLKIIPPNIMSPFHITNINGNKFNLVPKSKLSFHTQKVKTQNKEQAESTQAQKVHSEYEIQQEKSRLRVKLWSLNLMPETLDSILAFFLKDPKLEDLNLPDCSLVEIEKIRELLKS